MIYRRTEHSPLFSPPHNGTPTSAAAARSIAADAGTLRQLVAGYVFQQGYNGATDEEIQDGLGMPGSTERPRRVECVTAGTVRDSGRTRRTRSGRHAAVWVSTELGL